MWMVGFFGRIIWHDLSKLNTMIFEPKNSNSSTFISQMHLLMQTDTCTRLFIAPFTKTPKFWNNLNILQRKKEQFIAMKVKVTQLCLTLCNPMDYMVHGILQARIPEWVAFPFSRGSSQPRDWTQVFCIVGGFSQGYWNGWPIPSQVGLPNPGIKPGFPQVDSLPTELSGKPLYCHSCSIQIQIP